jgi:TRAP-type C4-dicarboxylate transport system permease small subunit
MPPQALSIEPWGDRRMEKLAMVLGAIARAALWLASICLVLMTAFVAWQVWGRYVLNESPNWTEPMSVMLMSWFIFLGSAVGTREGFHLSFDLLVHVLPKGGKAVLRSLSDLVVLVFGACMAIYGMQLVLGTWSSTLPSLHLPGGTVYIPLVAGGVLVAIFSLERLARRAAGLDTAEDISGGHAVAEG